MGEPPDRFAAPGPGEERPWSDLPDRFAAPRPGEERPWGESPDRFAAPGPGEERPWGEPPYRFAAQGPGEERPWGEPPDGYAAPGPDAMPPEPGTATRILGGPGLPPGSEALPGTGIPPAPPPGSDAGGWNAGVPPLPEETPPPPAGGFARKDRKTLLVAGAVAAAVVLTGGLVYALTKGAPGSGHKTNPSASAQAGGTAARQAAAVNRVLASGRAARGHLPSPLRTCADVSAGVPGFQQVVRDRQQELSQSRALKVDGLRNGPRLRRSMIVAYRSSLAADQAYLAWAQEIRARNCGGRIAPLTRHYKGALAANDKAGPAKRQVAALWRPIARSQKLPAYAWNRL